MLHSMSLCTKEGSGFVCRNLQIFSETLKELGLCSQRESKSRPLIHCERIKSQKQRGWHPKGPSKRTWMTFKVIGQRLDLLAHRQHCQMSVPSVCLHSDLCVGCQGPRVVFCMSPGRTRGARRGTSALLPYQPGACP